MLLYCWGFLGFILFLNGQLRSPVILQYFFDDFGNFENLVKIWTRRPPNYYQNSSKNTRKYGIIPRKYYFSISENLKFRFVLEFVERYIHRLLTFLDFENILYIYIYIYICIYVYIYTIWIYISKNNCVEVRNGKWTKFH